MKRLGVVVKGFVLDFLVFFFCVTEIKIKKR